MLIECPHCESRVDGKEIAQHYSYDPKSDSLGFRATLLGCPACKNTLLAGQYLDSVDEYDQEHWSMPWRLWPSPKRHFSFDIPEFVRKSLEEAERCYKARAYTACAVMCGRALEGICHHFKTESKNLGPGLKELLDRDIIDRRIHQWGEELRKHRNIGAHMSDQRISREDAEDLLNFAGAICEYVFVLNAKFESFMKRKKETPEKKSKVEAGAHSD